MNPMRNWGLIVRRECWTLSLRGKLLAAVLVIGLAAGLTCGAYPFLALNYRVRSDWMVVEGWTISHRLVYEIGAEFKRGHYRRILIVQDPYGENDTAIDLLVQYGMPREAIDSLTYTPIERDRTYHGAVATREWLRRNQPSVTCFDVVTIGPHARRSWLTFRKAFGKTAEIGVIALKDPDYDPRRWWQTSEGVRQVQGEVVAYLYAQLRYL